jgi:hypothetical protein
MNNGDLEESGLQWRSDFFSKEVKSDGEETKGFRRDHKREHKNEITNRQKRELAESLGALGLSSDMVRSAFAKAMPTPQPKPVPKARTPSKEVQKSPKPVENQAAIDRRYWAARREYKGMKIPLRDTKLRLMKAMTLKLRAMKERVHNAKQKLSKLKKAAEFEHSKTVRYEQLELGKFKEKDERKAREVERNLLRLADEAHRHDNVLEGLLPFGEDISSHRYDVTIQMVGALTLRSVKTKDMMRVGTGEYKARTLEVDKEVWLVMKYPQKSGKFEFGLPLKTWRQYDPQLRKDITVKITGLG